MSVGGVPKPGLNATLLPLLLLVSIRGLVVIVVIFTVAAMSRHGDVRILRGDAEVAEVLFRAALQLLLLLFGVVVAGGQPGSRELGEINI